ncbi:GntR family transcriptional regulator [Alkalihalobacillus sp. 1P02AB]|uniref:GntR family transcriptional regulator n=1 Tax=Alkalihalobacillus sp. 1P02AB TaxID=3132260 RepID=UPI0039A545DC
MPGLQHDSLIPLYHQLKEVLISTISEGGWKPGDKIASENQLMEQYGISRNTVKKAIEDLVKEGVLYRVQGKGTYVAKQKLEQPLTGFYSFSKVLKEKGMNPSDIIVEVKEVEPSKEVKQALVLEEKEKVILLKRIRCANDEPIVLEESFLPKKVVGKIELLKEVGTVSLYDLLEREFQVFVTRAKEAFEPILMEEEASQLLQTEKGFPALLLERTAYDLNGIPVEFCRSIVRGDRCRFYTELI